MLDIQTYLDNAVQASRAKTFARSDQLTLGEIIAKCEAIAAIDHELSDDSQPQVVFDFEYARPNSIDSWRGIYRELALNFSFEDDRMELPAFIEMLQGADGETFTGYKGGDFTMSRHTPVWVANYGNSGNTAVIDVVDDKWQVIIMTGYRES